MVVAFLLQSVPVVCCNVGSLVVVARDLQRNGHAGRDDTYIVRITNVSIIRMACGSGSEK